MAELKALFHDLIRFETELWTAIDARLRDELDLPLSRYEPMQVILRTTNCRVLDIASSLSIGVSGTSKIVDRLEFLGHCRRLPNPEDRRSSIVELTPEGTRLARQAEVVLEQELARRLGSSMSARALDQFADSLRRLRSAHARESTRTEVATGGG